MSTNTEFTKEELSHDQCPPHITGDRVIAWCNAKIDIYRALSLTQSHPPGLGLTLSQEKTQEGDTHAQSTLQDTPAVTSKGAGQPSTSHRSTHSDVHSSGKDEEEGDGTSTDIAAMLDAFALAATSRLNTSVCPACAGSARRSRSRTPRRCRWSRTSAARCRRRRSSHSL